MLAMRNFFLLALFAVGACLLGAPSLLSQTTSGAKSRQPVKADSPKSTLRRPAEDVEELQTHREPAPAPRQRGESIKLAQRRPSPIEQEGANAEAQRDPDKEVPRVASLTKQEAKERQGTPLRRSVTVYVPKLVTERQNVARTVMTPMTSHELRPVWSPGEGRWLTYRQTGNTVWTPRMEVVPMDVPVWKYVAETRYIDEPVAQRSYSAPVQTMNAGLVASSSAWAWKQQSPTGAGVQPIIPPYQPPNRPVLSFLKSRPLVGRLFGGNQPMFPPAPAPLAGGAPYASGYQPVSYYQPNYTPNYTQGTGVPAFSAPLLPTAGATGSYGGVRAFQ